MKTKLIIDDITDTELVTRIEKTNINAVDENNNEEAMDKKIITIDNDCTTLLIKNYHFSNDIDLSHKLKHERGGAPRTYSAFRFVSKPRAKVQIYPLIEKWKIEASIKS